MSLALDGTMDGPMPWETLEQPSFVLFFGVVPGTITLNNWVSTLGSPLIKLHTYLPTDTRDMALPSILERLSFAQYGLDPNVSISSPLPGAITESILF